MLTLFLCAAIAPQGQSDHSVNGLLNGDFETIDDHGRTSANPNQFDGAFWMGAEDRTLLSGTNRVLGLEAGERVLQRIGAAGDQTGTLTLAGNVLLPTNQDQAELTISDGPDEISTMKAFMATGNADNGKWEFFELDPVAGTLSAMTPNAAGTIYTGTLDTSNKVQYGKNSSFAWVDDFPVVTRWEAPRDGRVRAMWRSTFHPKQSGSNAADLHMEVSKNNGLTWSPTIHETALLKNEDTGGPVLIVELDVLEDDQLTFKLAVDPSEIGAPRSRAYHSPIVTYVGRKLTYVVGDAMKPLPTSTGDHAFVRVPATGFGTLTSFGTLNAGVDFTSYFGGAGNEPLPAIEVELKATESNTAQVQFDDISGEITWRTRTPDDLRDRILEEGEWVRDNAKMVTPGTTLPYDCDRMFLDGHLEDTFNGDGYFPIFLDEMLRVRFDRAEFELNDLLRQQELQLPLSSPAGLRHVKYRCKDLATGVPIQQYEAIPCNSNPKTGVAGELGRLVESYRESGDPAYLDIAYNYAFVLARSGVLDVHPGDGNLYTEYGDNCDGLILIDGYHLCTGQHSMTTAEKSFFLKNKVYEFATSPASMIRFYAEARDLNENLPSGFPERYSSAVLDFILSTAEVALDTAISVRNNLPGDANYPHPDDWGFNWLVAHGGFNDLFGYQGHQARRTFILLQEKSFGQPGIDPRIETLMKKLQRDDSGHDILWDGANHFHEFWTQIARRSGYGAADQGRSYPAYVYWVQELLASEPERDEFLEALTEQAYVATKLMETPHASWVNSANDWFELPDLGSGNGAGTGVGAPDHWLAVQLQAYEAGEGLSSSAVRDDLRAHVNTMLEGMNQVFATPYGYFLNFGWLDAAASSGSAAAYPVGAERRPIETLLKYSQIFGESLVAAPDVLVTPESLSQTTSTTNFTIRVEHPGSSNPIQDLQANTLVYLWRESASGDWERVEMWPSPPAGVTWNPPYSGVGADWAAMSLNAVPPGFWGVGDVKVSAVTHTDDLQWDWDTSMQEW